MLPTCKSNPTACSPLKALPLNRQLLGGFGICKMITPLLNAKGEQVSKGNWLPNHGCIQGIKRPTKARPNGWLVCQTVGGKVSTGPVSDFDLHWGQPSKPTKAEVKAQGHAANLQDLLKCWYINEHHEQGNMATGPFFTQLLAMARQADQWVAFAKKYPKLASQPV